MGNITFQQHLRVYIIVNAVLHAINFAGGERGIGGEDFYYWAFWPLLGWGIGLYFHWLSEKNEANKT